MGGKNTYLEIIVSRYLYGNEETSQPSRPSTTIIHSRPRKRGPDARVFWGAFMQHRHHQTPVGVSRLLPPRGNMKSAPKAITTAVTITNQGVDHTQEVP